MIASFLGPYRWLSNFHPAPVVLDGVTYPTVEHAFQAAKTLDPLERRRMLLQPNPGKVKRLGQRVRKRPDWKAVRLSVMFELLRQKFAHAPLRQALLETGDAVLIEGNVWGDVYWGQCGGVGQNHLGKLLMRVREEVRA